MTGRTFTFEVNRTSTAPPATLFRLETDAPGWATWAKPVVFQSSWHATGHPEEAGIGAVRKVGMWPLLMLEQTVAYEQDRRHVYELISPRTPAVGYHGEATFTPNAAGGTDLRWRGWFTEGVPGTGPVMRAALRGAIVALSARLVRAAERETAHPASG
ncbi:SRPBCC family protein [Mycolicibacterium grossiae]|uniref:MxaD family protein n=1 Tax=Mycolicibacterium grossiae TaxID=1552759 RepID=A0A1E8Q6F7_9MYCO|nr:SRPBCC family protein [Mycolicibacterium grossiae]OFJ54056.1 MxaD family protein [Mycolicibacterium grossiae]QEM44238.1 SRPBCC family protein [Mycolicibacterium grossiae]